MTQRRYFSLRNRILAAMKESPTTDYAVAAIRSTFPRRVQYSLDYVLQRMAENHDVLLFADERSIQRARLTEKHQTCR